MALDREDAKILAEELNRVFKDSNRLGTVRQLASVSQDPKTVELVNKQYVSMAKNIGYTEQDLETLRKELDKNAEKTKENTKAQAASTKAIKSAKESLLGLGDAANKSGDQISAYTKPFEKVPILGDGLNLLSGSLDFNVEMFRTLSSTGADFNKSLIDLRKGAHDTQLPLTDFADLVGKNSQTLSGLFGTTNQGAQRIAAFSEALRKEGIPQLAQLGFTTDNLNDFLGTFLERQRTQGRFGAVTQENTTRSVIAYAKELDLLAKATGLQREQIDEGIKQRQADSIFQNYLSGLDEDQARAAELLIETLNAQSPAFADAAKGIIATGVPFGELGEQLAGLNSGVFDTLIQFRRAPGDVLGVLDSLQKSSRAFLDNTDAATLAFGGFEQVGNASLAISKLQIDQAKAVAEQNAQADALTKTLAEFEEASKRLRSAFQSIQTAFLESLGPMISGILGGTEKSMMAIATSIRNFVKESPGLTATLFVGGLAGSLIFDVAKMATAVALGNKMSGISLGALGKGMLGIGKNLGVLGAGMFSLYELAKAGDKERTQEERKSSALKGVLSGAATGAMLGASFGVPGVLVGAGIGAAVSGIGALAQVSRASGGPLNESQLALVGEKGPELFVPKTPGEIMTNTETKAALPIDVANPQDQERMLTEFRNVNQMLSQNLTGMSDILKKSEQHLNTLVAVGVKTEKNTGSAQRILANQGASLV